MMNKTIRMMTALCLLLALVMTSAAASANVMTFPESNSLNFQYKGFLGGQTFKVYSGPGRHYWRGANGWAKVSSDEAIYCAGQEGNWLLVTYSTSSGTRVGYVTREDISENTSAKALHFDYTSRQITKQCIFTDDPSSLNNPIGYINAGATVTYLADYYNGLNWAYVESVIDGTPIRGFVPADSIR